MKKKSCMFLCIMILVLSCAQTVSADTGPKPSVQIDFEGLEGEEYYVTLLSEVSGTGPFSVVDEENVHDAHYKEGNEDYDIFCKFLEYEDADGYYFIQYFKEGTETQQFVWGYFPPERFKILLYFPERDYFLTDNKVYERYAFDSCYRVTVEKAAAETELDTEVVPGTEAARETEQSPDMEMTVEQNMDAAMEMTVEKEYGKNILTYARNILALIARAVITLVIELGIAYLFAFHEKRQLRLLVIANLITQLALNFALYLLYYSWGSWSLILFYIPLEILVFVTEGLLYTRMLNDGVENSASKVKIWSYAFLANLSSFVLGIWLSDKIPVIF